MVAVCFAFACFPLQWPKIIVIGMLLGLFVFGLRMLPIPFGLHSIIGCIFVAIVLNYWIHIRFLRALYGVFVAMACVIIFEVVCTQVLEIIWGVTYTEIRSNSVRWIISGIPQVILLFITAIVKNRINLIKGNLIINN